MKKFVDGNDKIWYVFEDKELAKKLGLPSVATHIAVSYTKHTVKIFCGETEKR